jgi:hypothetical protein
VETANKPSHRFIEARPHLRPTVDYAPRTGSTTQPLSGLEYFKWCTGRYITSYCAAQTVTLQESGRYLHAYHTSGGLIMVALAADNLRLIAPDLAATPLLYHEREIIAARWQLLHTIERGREKVLDTLDYHCRALLASGDTEELDIPVGAMVEDKYGDQWQLESRECDDPHWGKIFYFMATRQRDGGYYSLSYRDIAKLISVPTPA